MPKHVLVALPLSDAQRSALQASVPEYEFIFAQTETVTLAQVLEADIIMGNVPVELICQNHHLEWFQSNFAGPDTYLVPGVLPEQCLVTNATGAYGLAISEWMLGLWWGCRRICFCTGTARRSTSGMPSPARCGRWPGPACYALAWEISVLTLPCAPMPLGPRLSVCGAACAPVPPAPITACGWYPKANWTPSCRKRTWLP